MEIDPGQKSRRRTVRAAIIGAVRVAAMNHQIDVVTHQFHMAVAPGDEPSRRVGAAESITVRNAGPILLGQFKGTTKVVIVES
jgi:hypothetical protein